MNFRIDLPNPEVRELIMQSNYAALQKEDQLLKRRQKHQIFRMF